MLQGVITEKLRLRLLELGDRRVTWAVQRSPSLIVPDTGISIDHTPPRGMLIVSAELPMPPL
jgi:hypothetical protein